MERGEIKRGRGREERREDRKEESRRRGRKDWNIRLAKVFSMFAVLTITTFKSLGYSNSQ